MLCDPLPMPRPAGPADTPESFAKRVKELPPLIGGQRWIPPSWTPPAAFDEKEPGTYEQREGYFLVSVLVGLKLDSHRGVTGFMRINRGGRPFVTRELSGLYSVQPIPELPGMYGGIIRETHQGDGPKPFTWTYSFVVRNDQELEWIWQEGDHRPLVATGTFKKVRFSPHWWL
jgi:hypothetical protein